MKKIKTKRVTDKMPRVTISLTWKQAQLVEHQIEKAGAAWDEPWACREAGQILKRIDVGFDAAIRREKGK